MKNFTFKIATLTEVANGRWMGLRGYSTQAINARPGHAKNAARIVALAASLDALQMTLLITYLGAESAPGFAMFNGLPRSTRDTALMAAAKHALSPSELSDLKALAKMGRALDEHRNRLAHWLWCYSEQIEDGPCLLDPQANFEMLIAISKELAKGGPEIVEVTPETDLDRNRVLVYRQDDLKGIADAYEKLGNYVRHFSTSVNPRLKKRDRRFLFAQPDGMVEDLEAARPGQRSREQSGA